MAGRSRVGHDQPHAGYTRQSYQFGANAYAYEALLRCTNAQGAVTRLAATITDLSHYVDAFQSQRSG
jgi:hypothetical protein